MKQVFQFLLCCSFSMGLAAKTLTCKNTPQSLQVKATIKGSAIVDPSFEGEAEAYLLGKVLGTESKSGRWIRFGGIEGENCWHSLIIPAKFDKMDNQAFRGVVDRLCEGGLRSTSYRLNCTIK
jgi:hypothetical protein